MSVVGIRVRNVEYAEA